MDGAEYPCPVCGAPLASEKGPHGRRYVCTSGDGAAVGLTVLGQLLAEGVATQLWLASEDAPASGPRCPTCGQVMRVTTVPDGGATVDICRPCEMVWVPEAAWAQLPGSADASPHPPDPGPTKCPSCGAPWNPDTSGVCRYCHQQLQREPAVVFVPAPSTDLGDLAREAMRVGVRVGLDVRWPWSRRRKDD